MKKILIAVLSLCFISSIAQTKMIVKMEDGSYTDFLTSEIDSIYYSNTAPTPKEEHSYVDLGLPSGTLWATMNLGAKSDSDFGSYFAWGETEPKNNFMWNSYKWCDGTNDVMTKYNTKSDYGNVDNLKILLSEDDAATVMWGDGWRTPTSSEMAELRDNCTWTYTTIDYTKGYKVTGPNGSSIFLPAGGENSGVDGLSYVGYLGYYWTSTLHTGLPYYALRLTFGSTSYTVSYTGRFCGHTIRPVRSK